MIPKGGSGFQRIGHIDSIAGPAQTLGFKLGFDPDILANTVSIGPGT
jgi:hypothetical protein